MKERSQSKRNRFHGILFCGGSVAPRSRKMRKLFLKYSSEFLPEFRMFLAEAATKDLTHHSSAGFVNIADFEGLISEISNCIILILKVPVQLQKLVFSQIARVQ